MSLTKIITEISHNVDSFPLDPTEFKKFKDLFNSLGADISFLLNINDINEITAIPDTEKFERDLAIQIPRSTHTRLRDMIQEGLDAKDWYYKISNEIYTSLGESDGVLFLMILASTSPRNMLSSNFKEASVLYTTFKEDLVENEELLYYFITDEISPTIFSYDDAIYEELNIIQGMRDINISDVGAKLNNLKKTFKYYFDNSGNLNREESADYFASHFNPYSSTIKGIIDFESGEILQKSKVFNFTMNLLMPEYNVSIRNKTWYFVTIDSWMIRAMYPYLTKAEQNAVISHNAKYLYAQEKIMQFAKEISLEPHQVQASIWVAKLREAGKTVESFDVSIDKRIDMLTGSNHELRSLYSNLKSVIEGIRHYYSIIPEKDTPYKSKEEIEEELGYGLDDEAPF